MLAHELASERPGPVVAADQASVLGWAYFGLLTGWSGLTAWSDQTASVYVHPDGAHLSAPAVDRSAADQSRRDKLVETLNTVTLGDVMTSADAPRWLASNQRVLEQFAEPLLQGPPGDDIAQARRTGYKAGMEAVASILMDTFLRGKDSA